MFIKPELICTLIRERERVNKRLVITFFPLYSTFKLIRDGLTMKQGMSPPMTFSLRGGGGSNYVFLWGLIME